MKKLLVFIGDSGSGKTTLINELEKRYPKKFKKVVTCTSRSMRVSEVDGKDYHFHPQDFFVNNHDLVLVKYSEDGVCYGTKKQDLYSDTHHILLASRPSGIPILNQLGFQNIVIVHINISVQLKIERMRQRGDQEEEILKRLLIDKTMNKFNFDDISIIQIESGQSIEKSIALINRAC